MSATNIIGGTIAAVCLIILLTYAKLTDGKDMRGRKRKEREAKKKAEAEKKE